MLVARVPGYLFQQLMNTTPAAAILMYVWPTIWIAGLLFSLDWPRMKVGGWSTRRAIKCADSAVLTFSQRAQSAHGASQVLQMHGCIPAFHNWHKGKESLFYNQRFVQIFRYQNDSERTRVGAHMRPRVPSWISHISRQRAHLVATCKQFHSRNDGVQVDHRRADYAMQIQASESSRG